MKYAIRDQRKPGWLWLRNEVIDQYGAKIGAAGIAVYVALCRYADNDSQECFPSQAALGTSLGLSPPTVRKALGKLVECGLIASETRFDESGRQTSNLYYLLDLPPVEKIDTPPRYKNDAGEGYKNFPRTRPIELDSENKTEEMPGATPLVADATPTAFPGWLALIRSARNRVAVLVRMYTALFPDHDPPDYGYMGKAARAVGGASNLARLLWEASVRPPVGDVLAYVLQVHRGQAKRGNNRRNGSGDEPTLADFEAIAYGGRTS